MWKGNARLARRFRHYVLLTHFQFALSNTGLARSMCLRAEQPCKSAFCFQEGSERSLGRECDAHQLVAKLNFYLGGCWNFPLLIVIIYFSCSPHLFFSVCWIYFCVELRNTGKKLTFFIRLFCCATLYNTNTGRAGLLLRRKHFCPSLINFCVQLWTEGILCSVPSENYTK